MVFSVDQVLASQIKTEEETSWVKPTPHCGSAIGHPSLIHKSGSIQHSKTVQFPKLFSHSSPCFLLDQGLASLIRTERRLNGWSWLHIVGQLFITRLWYTSQDPFSTARQSSFQNYFHTLLLVFCWTKALHHWSGLRGDLMGEADSTLWVSCSSPVSDTQVRIHSAQQDSPVSKTIFTLFSLFFVRPSLSITDQDLLSQADSTLWISCWSPVSDMHTLLFIFLCTKS